jgi:hypothetical protein
MKSSKGRNPRNADYLDFVRSLPCTYSGLHDGVVAHHCRILGGGGMGLKPSDYRCVPLTEVQHRQLHQMGEGAYWRKLGRDPRILVIAIMRMYLKERFNERIPDSLMATPDLREMMEGMEALIESCRAR